MIKDILEKELLKSGADIVGFSDLRGIVKDDISHLERGVSIAVSKRLHTSSVRLLKDLQKSVVNLLKKNGYRYLVIPPDSDRGKDTFISRLYPLFTHKIAATSSGIGWIGRNGLLINPEFGPRLSLATVLTDAPVRGDEPVESSRCGDCTLCIDYCPSKALTGSDWSRRDPYVEIVKYNTCRTYKKKSKTVSEKPNCGLCITVCPYGRKNSKKGSRGRGFEDSSTKKSL